MRLRCCAGVTVTAGNGSRDCAKAGVANGGSSKVVPSRAGVTSTVVAIRIDRRRLMDVFDMCFSS